jgi:phospholipid N-methyltransferase
MNIRSFVGRRKKDAARQLLVLKELALNPRGMGALCPSSAMLAKEMASAVPLRVKPNDVFIEIGAGTGPVTAALLQRGIPSDRLIVIEKSPALAECLASRFPQINVSCRGAERMSECLKGDERVRAIVSSLPFRSLPRKVSFSIMAEIERVLAPRGLFIQFTYALAGTMRYIPPGFKKLRSNIVFLNIPPAKVEVYMKPRLTSRR